MSDAYDLMEKTKRENSGDKWRVYFVNGGDVPIVAKDAETAMAIVERELEQTPERVEEFEEGGRL